MGDEAEDITHKDIRHDKCNLRQAPVVTIPTPASFVQQKNMGTTQTRQQRTSEKHKVERGERERVFLYE